MKRIVLKYKQNNFTVLCDFHQNRFVGYAPDFKKIHDKYGGERFYSTDNGEETSGWINSQPGLSIVKTYRTDQPIAALARYFDWLRHKIRTNSFKTGDIENWHILVPINRGGKRIEKSYPVICVLNAPQYSHRIHIIPQKLFCEQLPCLINYEEFCRGMIEENTEYETVEFVFHFWDSPDEQSKIKKHVQTLHTVDSSTKKWFIGHRKGVCKRLAFARCHSRLKSDFLDEKNTPDFLAGLELYRPKNAKNDFIFRTMSGVAVERYSETLLTDDLINYIAPPWVTILAPGYYVSEKNNKYMFYAKGKKAEHLTHSRYLYMLGGCTGKFLADRAEESEEETTEILPAAVKLPPSGSTAC